MAVMVDSKNMCCGCKACADVCHTNAIHYSVDNEGFWYPTVDISKCVDCKKCEQICPQLIEIEKSEPKAVYATKNKDDEEVLKSSSGGVFSVLARKVIEEKNGHVYAVKYDENLVAKFFCITDISGIEAARGSKYVQADAGYIYKQIVTDLKNGTFVLFIGTPCQAAAVRKITERYTDLILIVDFICHGVPSPEVFKSYINYVEKKKHKKIVGYNNRCKKKGWKHTEEIFFQDGKSDYESCLSQAWRNLFYTHNCLRMSCYECRFNHYERRLSDVTIADYWGIKDVHPDFPFSKGASVFIPYTKKGEEWKQFVENELTFMNSYIDGVLKLQPHYKGEAAKPNNRDTFWKDYYEKGMGFVTKKYGKCSIDIRIKTFVKRVLKR